MTMSLSTLFLFEVAWVVGILFIYSVLAPAGIIVQSTSYFGRRYMCAFSQQGQEIVHRLRGVPQHRHHNSTIQLILGRSWINILLVWVVGRR